ncbi:ornithine carbamoyltransferase [Haloquadratum walsbyi]|jgi:ornithine carbamoyltransferase (EC 2.1.3.3)|uniref:Ornithine carbamoyltransferase n=1 Tax=Haloquadratum walsbyi J07HQW2 TaxID=1238425 RepID=U1NFP6_9EURY|nr:ornithine carbamoyltransferase [Haloquadratum walsbyi]ERG95900.1 MAG: ornithine carbamoyltransferase [Haloquadratum walsbyi J07HQW2]
MPNSNDFLDIDDLTTAELQSILGQATALKRGNDDTQFPNRTLGMLFEKPSTRTRISFETGMTELGGHAIFLGPDDIQLGHGEPLSDTARVLSGYVDVVMARLFDHDDLLEIAAHADIPVINGLTDDAHPCQTLADLLTIKEEFDGFDDVQVVWIGDGNNVGQSLVIGAAMVGLDLTIVTPPGYGMDQSVLEQAAALGQPPTVADTPAAAVNGSDVVYTDVWISMGQEEQRDKKLAAFEGYQVNESLLADSDAQVMHCLPAHRGEEITDEVLTGTQTLVWEQAENRLHAQKGLLVELLSKN